MKKIYLKIVENIKIDKNLLNKVKNIIKKKNIKNISKQKNRGEVSYSNKKPWKQKGTGSARAGRKSSPIWVKGGRAFAKGEKKTNKKINKRILILFKKMLFLQVIKKCSFYLIKNKIKKIKKKTLFVNNKKKDIELENSLKNKIKILNIGRMKYTSIDNYKHIIFNKKSIEEFLKKHKFIKYEYK